MDRLFSSGCHIPNVSSYGSCLRSIDHCDDVDDNSTALLLSYPKWAFSLACIFSYLFFGAIEVVFFISSVVKFFRGGFVAVLIGLIILVVMFIWEQGNIIRESSTEDVSLRDYIPQLRELRDDTSLPIYQTNVVFLVPDMAEDKVGRQFIYSILDKRPKRARVYWFVHVEVTDEPYTKEYQVDMMDTDFIVQVNLFLGFRVQQEINVYVRQVIHDLMKQGRLPKQPQRYSLTPGREVGDFQFVLIDEVVSNVTTLGKWQRQIMQAKLAIKNRYLARNMVWARVQRSKT